jgi:hypothetical protein
MLDIVHMLPPCYGMVAEEVKEGDVGLERQQEEGGYSCQEC